MKLGSSDQTTNSNRILLYRHRGPPTLFRDRLFHPSIPSVIGYNSPLDLEHSDVWERTPEDEPGWKELAERLPKNGVTPLDVTSTPPPK